MTPSVATVVAWSYGVAGVGYAAFLLHLLAGRRAGQRNPGLLVAVGACAVWGLAGMAYGLTQAPVSLLLCSLADLASIGGWYALLLILMRRGFRRIEGEPLRLGWLLPCGAGIVVWGLLAQVLAMTRSNVLGDPGRLWVFFALAAAVFGLVLIEQLFRNVAEDSRWSITPLCLGLGGAFSYDIYLYTDALLFNRVDPDAWSVRGIVYALALPLVMLSISRTRAGSARIVLSRQVMFRSTALLMSGIYLLLMAGAGYYVRYFGGEWGRALQLALVFAGVLILGMLVLSGSMRAKLRVSISKHFFSYRYDYRDEWLRFTQALSSQDQQLELKQQVIKGLADLVESPGGAVWLRDGSERMFVPSGRWNMPASEGSEDVTSELSRFLGTRGWVINLEEYRSSPDRYGGLHLPLWLSEISNAWLVVPLTSGSDLVGFVVLATARTAIEVNWEVNDLLKTAGRQAASFLGQMQATEALLEARKFDAFNRMSAFVVHDLKNIVAQLSLMLKNAERHRDNPEFQQDMLMTVENSVERMKKLMLQLREGTTPADVTHAVDLAEIVGRIERSKSTQEPMPEVLIEDKVSAKGHEDRLERVIGHLVQNAIDATDKSGRVWIKLSRQGRQALVEVGDTGHGMTPEFVRDRLFKPFQTTKPHGMGIGAYESYQYVQELGGQVLVDSSPTVGTRVRVLLPLFEATSVPVPHRDIA